jgi:phosphatidylinositol-3-phosphatase
VTRARPTRFGVLLCAVVTLVAGSACSAAPPAPATTPSATESTGQPSASASPPGARTRPDHIVVVVFENKSAAQIDGNASAPYFNSLMADSAVLTKSRAIAHPSQPNYLALFSGSTQNITDDSCPLNLGDRPNLGRQLIDAGFSFTGYSEGLPAVGYTGCSSGRYAAKHSPWVHFGNLPPTVNQPGTAFPADFSTLPTVAFLIPDLCNDMHDCSISIGDSWLRHNLDPYVRWARDHNSLLVVTFDEDDSSADNRILTFVSGAGVRPGRYAQPVDHYGLLSTMEDVLGLARLGMAATAPPITDIWLRPPETSGHS